LYWQGLGKPKSLPHRNKGPEGAARQAEQQRKAAEKKNKRALRARVHESHEKEVAKLIREGMDPVEAQDLVDAWIPEDPKSGSDGEEEGEELELPGAVDFGPEVSPRGASDSGTPKRARDEAEPGPEPAKWFRGEGLGAPGVVSDVPPGCR